MTLPTPSDRATGHLPKNRRRLRTVDFNRAVELQKKGATMREISDILQLPHAVVVDDLYWDARS